MFVHPKGMYTVIDLNEANSSNEKFLIFALCLEKKMLIGEVSPYETWHT